MKRKSDYEQGNDYPTKRRHTEQPRKFYPDGYDSEGYGDENDRAYLESLSEIKREDIIYERKEARQRQLDAKMLQDEAKNQQDRLGGNTDRSKNDKKAALSDIGKRIRQTKTKQPQGTTKDVSSPQTPPRDVDKHRDRHISTSVSSRDRDKSRNREKERDREKETVKRVEKGDRDGASERDREEDGPSHNVITLDELKKIILSREDLEKHINSSHFENFITNCFVRVLLGQNATTGKNTYRLAQIIDVREGSKTYQFGKGETNKLLHLKHGMSKKYFNMDIVSNQEVTQSEFSKWLDEMHSTDEHVITNEEIEERRAHNEAIVKELRKQNVKSLTKQKNELVFKRDLAHTDNKPEIVKQLTAQIEDVDRRLAELQRASDVANVNIQNINKRNREANIRIENTKKEDKVENGAKPNKLDPFSRRPTRQTNYFTKGAPDGDSANNSDTGKAKEGDVHNLPATKISKNTIPANGADVVLSSNNASNNGNGVSTAAASLVDAHALVDLDIDIVLPSQDLEPEVKKPVLRCKPSVETTTNITANGENTKKLSVDDYYKRRRGLI